MKNAVKDNSALLELTLVRLHLYMSLGINSLQNVRPLKNGSIARPEERGRREPTDVGDLA
ncbi:MAG TPA: hypothetical protein DHV51_01055 [Opitutae bacterium]|nr:hypothetical protein [Opitutae bacterium]